ncbi:hypothetical protein BTE77_35250 [Ensifer adhaerens]|nr:hypothetical protein BTE77_35250 [Ensifer adhaerens]
MTHKNNMKIAVVTPTHCRPDFLRQTLRYVRAQTVQAEVAWFILDDSPNPVLEQWAHAPNIFYVHVPEKLKLGEKRNRLNDMASAWGADLICSMDDDDWYGPDYLADMASLLAQPGVEIAGSGAIFFYHVQSGRILAPPAVRPMTTCNGVLCYRTSLLQVARYNLNSSSGEEPTFIGRRPVGQHPRIQHVNLALAHDTNTVSKRNYFLDRTCHTELSLEEFPMEEADRQFYRNLTAEAAPRVGSPAAGLENSGL